MDERLENLTVNKKTPEGENAGCVCVSMLNGNGKWSSVSTSNVCRRDGDVLLGTNTLEDKLHTGVPLLLKTKLTSVLPPCMLRVWG